jgi:hypothetical protein
MKRTPVIDAGKYELFRWWLRCNQVVYGITDNADVNNACVLLDEALTRAIYETQNGIDAKKPKQKQNLKRKYVAIFKTRYLQWTDNEYYKVITQQDMASLTHLLDSLEEWQFTVDEYLSWFFDVFGPANKEIMSPPSIGLSYSNFTKQKFYLEHREEVKNRADNLRITKEVADLTARARTVYRTSKDSSILTSIQNYREGKILLSQFRKDIDEFENKHLAKKGVTDE